MADLLPALRNRLKAKGITELFPIQKAAFAPVAAGKDVIAKARTGSGKTLGFALPTLQALMADPALCKIPGRKPRAIVLSPTRELAKQTADEFALLGAPLAVTTVYGGTAYDPQLESIRRGTDVVVGTPGRVKDLVDTGRLSFAELKFIILDEADRMFDLGFREALDELLVPLIAASKAHGEGGKTLQVLLFSATMPHEVKQAIDMYTHVDRVTIDLIGNSKNRTSETVTHHALKCPWFELKSIIPDLIQVHSGQHGRCVVFTETKKDCNELGLNEDMKQGTQLLHGDISQKQRELTLQGFRDGKFQCLVATDVAARGLDIPEVDLVVQCEPPRDVDSYIHRSGRTGRAGRAGVCIIMYSPAKEFKLREVERKAGIKFKPLRAPQLTDIVVASARDAKRSIEAVPDQTLPLFEQAAQELMDEKGALKAVCAALAFISGNGSVEITERSALSSLPGFTAYQLWTESEVHSKGLLWSLLDKFLPEVKDTVKGAKITKDKHGIVFDV